MKLYIGNLSYTLTEADLEEAFSEYGTVTSTVIIKDRVSGRSKGFGFIELDDESAGNAAIEGLNGKEIAGRPVVVNVARPKTERPSRPRY